MRTWLPCVCVFLVSILIGPAALASPESRANDVAADIMSPFCPGVTLHECPSAAARELHARIKGWFADGWTRTEVMRELEGEYGTGIRAAPEPRGSGLIVWLLPTLALVAGGTTVSILLRRWVAKPPPESQSISVSENEHALVERELAALRRPQ